MAAAAPMRDNYMFKQEPKAVQHRRSHYRTDGREIPGIKPNIMHDSRVMRGSTYAPKIPHLPQGPESYSQTGPAAGGRKKPRTPRAATVQARASNLPRIPTPEPVPGRQHMVVQTDNYLEDLREKVLENDFGTQTDADMDRPEPALFKPISSGLDMYTWIEENDLFDFDLEVEPVLNVLSSRGLEQSLLEVLEEEELKEMGQHRSAATQLRNAKLTELQRLRAKDDRFEAEKARRIEQAKIRVVEIVEELAKREAATRAKEFFTSMQEDIISSLATSGYFFDPVLKQVQNTFLPWLTKQVGENLNTYADGRQSVHQIVNMATGSGLQQTRLKLCNILEKLSDAEVERELRKNADLLDTAEEATEKKPVNYSSLGLLGMGVEYGELDSLWRGAGRSTELLATLCAERDAHEKAQKLINDKLALDELERLKAMRSEANSKMGGDGPPDDEDPEDDDQVPFDDQLADDDSEEQILNKLASRFGVVVETDSNGRGVRVLYCTTTGSGSQASLVKGDIITKINDTVCTNDVDFRSAESGVKVGTVATVLVLRGVDEREEALTIEGFAKNTAYPPMKVRNMREALGQSIHSAAIITDSDARAILDKTEGTLGVVHDDEGLVSQITSGGPSFRAGLLVGDVITKLGGVAVVDFKGGKVGEIVSCVCTRDGKELECEIECCSSAETVERIRSLRVIAKLDKSKLGSSSSSSSGSSSDTAATDEEREAAKLTLDGLQADLGLGGTNWMGDQEGVTAGVQISKMVRGGPAMQAGLGWGDIVYNINDSPVPDEAALAEASKGFRAGDVLKVWIVRGTTKQKDLISLEVGAAAETLASIRTLRRTAGETVNDATLHTKESAYEAIKKLNPKVGFRISDEGEGVVVTQVHAGGPAEKAMVVGGDKVLKIGETEINNNQEFIAAVKPHEAGGKMEITMAGKSTVVLELGAQAEGEEKENFIEQVRALRCIAEMQVGLDDESDNFPLM